MILQQRHVVYNVFAPFLLQCDMLVMMDCRPFYWVPVTSGHLQLTSSLSFPLLPKHH